MINFDFVPAHEVGTEIAMKLPEVFGNLNEDYGDLNLDWDYYTTASENGQCFVVTMRDDDKLVGYNLFLLCNEVNHKDVLEASNASLFVSKKYRGRASLELLEKSESYLKGIGVKTITYLLKDKIIGRLLSRRGYVPEYVSWSLKNG